MQGKMCIQIACSHGGARSLRNVNIEITACGLLILVGGVYISQYPR